MPDVTDSLDARLAMLVAIFRPAAPTEDRSMFMGRVRELQSAVSAVQQLGQHVIVYGERGIGKTSLAFMARDTFRAAHSRVGLAVRVGCSNEDTFDTVWLKLIPRIRRELDTMPPELAEKLAPLVGRYEDILEMESTISPDSVTRALNIIAETVPFVVILDEFDRLGAWDDTVRFADLIKTLSDDLVKCTIFIVGVADNVDGLLAGHASIGRALRQVHMPRMSNAELTDLIVGGFEKFEQLSGTRISVPDKVIEWIVALSQGFPYYTHLLAGSLGAVALRNTRETLTSAELDVALVKAVEDAHHSIRTAYLDAVASSKPARFDLTLLGCALVSGDELGYFAPGDVREPLSRLSGRERGTPTFLAHLKRFADKPFYILETRGEGRTTRYRFRDPLMRPFVVMKGLKDGHDVLYPQ